jgi:hypothetical protein
MARFELVEGWLDHPSFWRGTEAADYYAELTLWAMLMSLAGGQALPPTYGICTPEPGANGAVSGHYCGSGRWALGFYTAGLPHVIEAMRPAGLIGSSN